jgi:RNA polymerase sigma-B factor
MTRHQSDRTTAETARRQRTDDLLEQAAAETDDGVRRDLLDEVVVLNLPIAHSIAWRFRGRGCAVEDLEQTASLALIRAANDFDPARGYHFLSYAVPCMTGSVKKYFRDFGWTVRPPRLVQELQQRLSTAQQTIDPATGRQPTPAQLAHTLGVDEPAVVEAMQADGCFTPTSLDLSVRHGDMTIGDQLVADDDGALGAVEARAMLRPALARLSADERSLLAMRFVGERTQQQMAEELGTTQPAVSRLLGRILGDLQTTLTREPEEPAPAA